MGRRARHVALWSAALVVVGLRLLQARTALVFADDLDVYWSAGRAVLDGTDPWVPGFVYLPAALAAFVPLGALPLELARDLGLVAGAVAVAGTAIVVARRAALPVPAVVGLTFLAFPTESALQFGNLTGLELPLLLAATTAARAGRWRRVAVVLGVAVALKPVLVPCLLVLLIRRRFRDAALAVAVPLVTSGVVLLVVGDPAGWIRTVRAGLRTAGQDPASADLAAVLSRLGSSAVLTVLAAVVVLGATAGALVVHRGDAGFLLVLPLLPAFLLGSVSWAHYPLLVLPLVVTSATAGRWERRLAVGAVVVWTLPELVVGSALRAVPPAQVFGLFTVGLVALLAASAFPVRAEPAVRR